MKKTPIKSVFCHHSEKGLRNELDEFSKVEMKQKSMIDRLGAMRDLLTQNCNISQFDPDLFEALIKNVIVGGYDNENNKEPYMLTFVFSTKRNTIANNFEYTVIDELSMATNFYSFKTNSFGERTKESIDKIIIRIAIENC